MNVIGIDIGGTKCAACLAANGMLLAREEFLTAEEPNPEAVLVRLATVAKRLLASQGLGAGSVAGVGVSCGGPLDADAGLICSPPNLTDWVRVPAKAVLERELGLPARLENDANATAVAEWKLGAGRGFRSLAFLTVGTGIGAGIILDGKLYRGKRGLAGEVGHATVLPDGPECLCGKRGCLEALASGSSLGRAAAAGLLQHPESSLNGAEVTGRAVVEAFLAGDAFARSAMLTCARYLGIGIANLLQTLDLERVILGTIAVHAGEEYLNAVRASAREHTWPSIFEGVDIVPCGLGDRAQDYAAISLWLD